MAKERKDKSFIKKPIYLGGTKAYRQFIKDNLKYPKAALKAKVEGVVLIRYSIDYKGKVIDAKVLKGIGHGCDKEAIRIIKLLKFEIPKGPRKLKVLFHKENKITFRLPIAKPVSKKKTAPQTTTTQLTYTLVKQKKTETKETEKTKVGGSKQSYTYTINW